MNEAWNQTQTRLRKWQRESSTGWDLRRVLSDSEYFKVIAICAHKRVKNPPKDVSWQDWWAFHLERMAEREAIDLLLEAWNKDVWAHINHQIRATAQQALDTIAEQSRLAYEFSVALDNIVSGSLPPQGGRSAPKRRKSDAVDSAKANPPGAPSPPPEASAPPSPPPAPLGGSTQDEAGSRES